MRWWSRYRTAININKDELLDAVNATDVWIDENQASFNQALPLAARDNLTLEQKTFLFCVVALARSSVTLLRSILGEVD